MRLGRMHHLLPRYGVDKSLNEVLSLLREFNVFLPLVKFVFDLTDKAEAFVTVFPLLAEIIDYSLKVL